MERAGSGVCPDCKKSLPYAGEGDALRTVNGYPSVHNHQSAQMQSRLSAPKYAQTPSENQRAFGRIFRIIAIFRIAGSRPSPGDRPDHFPG